MSVIKCDPLGKSRRSRHTAGFAFLGYDVRGAHSVERRSTELNNANVRLSVERRSTERSNANVRRAEGGGTHIRLSTLELAPVLRPAHFSFLEVYVLHFRFLF